MNKLYYTICVLLVAISAHAQFVHTNYAAVDANDVSGNFDSYNWVFLGQDSQEVTLDISFSDVTNDLSSLTLGWKASLNTRTGQVDYIVVSNSQITASTAQITFSVTNTAIPPDAVYQSELFGYTGASTGISRTLAQGIVDVRNSLYENDAQFTFPTNVAGDYVRKDGDFDQFSGLTGTNDQIWVADGSGGGAWSIAYQTASDANSAKITLNSTTNAVNTAGVAANLAKITLNSNTNAANTSAIAVLNTNAFTVDGLNSMQANADLGGNSLTNVLDGDFAGDVTADAIVYPSVKIVSGGSSGNYPAFVPTATNATGHAFLYFTNSVASGIVGISSVGTFIMDYFGGSANSISMGTNGTIELDSGSGGLALRVEDDGSLTIPNIQTNEADVAMQADLNVTSNITASGVLENTTNILEVANAAQANATANSNTNVANTAGIAVLNTNAVTVDGLNAMQADLNMGGANGITNLAYGEYISWGAECVGFSYLSATQAVTRFWTGSAFSNKYFNMVSD